MFWSELALTNDVSGQLSLLERQSEWAILAGQKSVMSENIFDNTTKFKHVEGGLQFWVTLPAWFFYHFDFVSCVATERHDPKADNVAEKLQSS